MNPTESDRAAASALVRRRWRRALGIGAALIWAVAVASGLERLWVFKSTPGEAALGPNSWPGSRIVVPEPGKPTLVMFVHPRCSCSGASLQELKTLMEHEHGRVSAWVLFLHPHGAVENWERTSSWETARAIPGVKVGSDADGGEAARFGASTSGHVVLYDPWGRFLFGGGITSARGHVGGNTGLERVASFIESGKADRNDHAVFGCGLADRHARVN